MSVLTPELPITSARNSQYIRKLREAYPFVRSQIIGYTAYGRPLEAIIIGNGPKNLLYTAAHHANEWITAPVLLKFSGDYARALAQDESIFGVSAKSISDAVTLYIIPLVNPDGVDLVTGAIPVGSPEFEKARSLAANYPAIPFPDGWKANLMGVDLNLNYPAGWEQARRIKASQGYISPGPRDFPGTAPLDQLETQALAGLTETLQPDLILAYHSQGQVIYWRYQDVEVPGAEALGEKLAAVSGYTLENTPYKSGFAGYKDWFIQQFRRPGYTVEVGLGENPLPISQFDEIYRNNLGLLVTAAVNA